MEEEYARLVRECAVSADLLRRAQEELQQVKLYYRGLEKSSLDLAREVLSLIHGIEGERDVGNQIFQISLCVGAVQHAANLRGRPSPYRDPYYWQ